MPNVHRVVMLSGASGSSRTAHETLSQVAMAQRLATVLGHEFGAASQTAEHGGVAYFVPTEPLLHTDAVRWGIRSEKDLYGGVAPERFAATKVLAHAVLNPSALVPDGWSHALADRLRSVVLPGFSAFGAADAQRAGELRLQQGRVRVKPARPLATHAHRVVETGSELHEALVALDPDGLRDHGVVLEHNLDSPRTLSIGEVLAGGTRLAYYGVQSLTRSNDGTPVYGGSQLRFVRGGLADLLAPDLSLGMRQAIEQALAYDIAVNAAFPRFFASRRSYDVLQGERPDGRRLSGVLGHAWRIGSASAAEILALEAFRADQRLRSLRASTHEVYSPSEAPPPHAWVYYDGVDPVAGRLLKYAMIEPGSLCGALMSGALR
ncbi:MAG TPA: DUF3182 family protein [Rudaea sp.]